MPDSSNDRYAVPSYLMDSYFLNYSKIKDFDLNEYYAKLERDANNMIEMLQDEPESDANVK